MYQTILLSQKIYQYDINPVGKIAEKSAILATG